MKRIFIFLTLLSIGAISISSCDSGSPQIESNETPPLTSPTDTGQVSCSDNLEALRAALDAYRDATGHWPTIDGNPGDVEWPKLIPGYLAEIPATDSICNWQINSDPEGIVCLWAKTNEGSEPSSSTSSEVPVSEMQITGQIQWVTNFDEALDLAQIDNKLVIANFYRDTCSHCENMFNTTYSDEDLGQFLNKEFVFVKINTPETTIDADYNIESVPTTVFMDSEGNEFLNTRVVGSKSADVIRERAEQVLASWNQPPVSPSPIPSETPISEMRTTGKIQWVSDWDEALHLAQAGSRPIIINFYRDTCPYCRKMYHTTFSDEDLGQFLSDNFILIKINTPVDTLDSEFDIESVPTTVFTDSEGKEFPDTRIVGSKPADVIRESAEQVLAAWNQQSNSTMGVQ